MTKALKTIAADINHEHQQAETKAREAITHARKAGRLLREAKAQCKHGTWLPWLADNFDGSKRTAQAYMRIAERWGEIEAKAQNSALLGIDGALRLLTDKADWLPTRGAAMCSDGITRWWFVWPISEKFSRCMVLDMWDEGGFIEGTRRGVRTDRLVRTLNRLGLMHPEQAEWSPVSSEFVNELYGDLTGGSPAEVRG